MRMKTPTIIAIVVVAVIAAVLAFIFIDVDQTRAGKLPEVNVTVEEGQLPEFKVETGSIEVGTEETTILVPKVVMVEETVTVPTVEVTPAGE